jgi:DNA polymerase III delta subunit
VTSARERGELQWLRTLAARGVAIDCVRSEAAARRWAARIVGEEALKLPSGATEALAASSPDLLALTQEVRKLAAHADRDGRVPAAALESLRATRPSGSLDRWADAVLAGDRARAAAERAGLASAGIGGTAALWAVAERALAALEGGAAFGRGPRGAAIAPRAARSALHAVYRADRAMKRGLARDDELMDLLEEEVRQTRVG